MEKDERLLDEGDGEDKQNTTEPKEKATDAVRISSVGTLAKNFMKNRDDKDFGQILVSAIASCRGCLEAAFPGCVV